MQPSSMTPNEDLQVAINLNDRRKVMDLVRQGAIVTENMINESLSSKPVSLCLILIGGYSKTSGVEALYEQAASGKMAWLDTLINQGLDLTSPYAGYESFWELVIHHGNKLLADHLIELSKTVKNNQSLIDFPTHTSIREKQNILLKLFLMNNANPNFVRDCAFVSLLEEARRKKNQEAIELLLQHGADEKYPEKVKFAMTPQDVARRTNHVIGITQKNVFIDLPETKIAVPLHNESLNRLSSLDLIASGLKAYLEAKPDITSNETTLLRQILDAYQFEREHISEHNYQNQLVDRWKNKMPIIIESGWLGHSVGIAIFNDTLIFCNRGMLKDPNYNLLFYKISDLDKITPDFIQILRNNHSPAALFRYLKKVVDMDYPISGIKIPDQTGGVCMTANTRSLIEGLLVAMQPSTETMSLERGKTIFDDYINFTFLNEVKLLLSELKNTKTKEERDFYYLIFKELLIQLPKNKETNKNQNELMKYILNEIPKEFIQKLKMDIPDIITSLTKEVKEEILLPQKDSTKPQR